MLWLTKCWNQLKVETTKDTQNPKLKKARSQLFIQTDLWPKVGAGK